MPLIHEIKGLKLEQVDELYATVSKAWKSTKFRQSLSFREVDEVDTRKKLREISDTVNRRESRVQEVLKHRRRIMMKRPLEARTKIRTSLQMSDIRQTFCT